jgi:hypothetical protein
MVEYLYMVFYFYSEYMYSQGERVILEYRRPSTEYQAYVLELLKATENPICGRGPVLVEQVSPSTLLAHRYVKLVPCVQNVRVEFCTIFLKSDCLHSRNHEWLGRGVVIVAVLVSSTMGRCPWTWMPYTECFQLVTKVSADPETPLLLLPSCLSSLLGPHHSFLTCSERWGHHDVSSHVPGCDLTWRLSCSLGIELVSSQQHPQTEDSSCNNCSNTPRYLHRCTSILHRVIL